MLVGLFDFELSDKDRRASAGINKVTRPDRVRRTVRSYRKFDAVVRELNAINRSLLAHFRAGFGGMIEQQLVEITACDLIRVIGLRAVAVLEVKLRSSVGARTHDFAPVLFQEPGAQNFLMQTQPGKSFHTERQQRFADVKPWKSFALEHNHAAPREREQRRGSAAS